MQRRQFISLATASLTILPLTAYGGEIRFGLPETAPDDFRKQVRSIAERALKNGEQGWVFTKELQWRRHGDEHAPFKPTGARLTISGSSGEVVAWTRQNPDDPYVLHGPMGS